MVRDKNGKTTERRNKQEDFTFKGEKITKMVLRSAKNSVRITKLNKKIKEKSKKLAEIQDLIGLLLLKAKKINTEITIHSLEVADRQIFKGL